uniref:Uncharacterized protein n=1 Tax=Tetranychus urticae TaxID=32264 RepID=T1K3T2_TETUR
MNPKKSSLFVSIFASNKITIEPIIFTKRLFDEKSFKSLNLQNRINKQDSKAKDQHYFLLSSFLVKISSLN